jgi:hypothetical protein
MYFLTIEAHYFVERPDVYKYGKHIPPYLVMNKSSILYDFLGIHAQYAARNCSGTNDSHEHYY